MCRSEPDVYWSRRSIAAALKNILGDFRGVLLDIGCGSMPYKDILLSPKTQVTRYIGMDLSSIHRASGPYAATRPDIEWDGSTIPIASESIDCAIATEMLHECPYPERVLCEVQRVLRPGCKFFFTVPFMWPIHDAPFDQYRYTPFALDRLLRSAGFDGIDMHSLGGWDASLAQMIALWLCRRPLRRPLRLLLGLGAAPIIRLLYRADDPLPVFRDQMMLTGIAGIAIKQPLHRAHSI
jgi:SAM-dependent methyltransferase